MQNGVHHWWTCEMMQPLKKTVWQFLKNKKSSYHMIQQFHFQLQSKELKRDLQFETKRSRSQRDTCIPIFNTALFAATKRWKQPKYPSTDEWINKMQYIHTMEYYSDFQKKEILTHVTTCMNFMNIVLSEKRQSQKY